MPVLVRPSAKLPSIPYVRMFKERDFKGLSLVVDGTNVAKDLRYHDPSFNDKLTSFYILRGYWEFFEHIDYGGYVWRYPVGLYRHAADIPVTPMPDGVISSVRYQNDEVPAAPHIMLFTLDNYTGTAEEHKTDKLLLQHHDAIRSIIVLNGVWRLFLDANHSAGDAAAVDVGPGFYTYNTPEESALKVLMARGISSIKIVG